MMLDLSPDAAIIGRATVIDGDTLEIRGVRIRLWGVDAFEGRQRCGGPASAWRCGEEAARVLVAMTGQNAVSCAPRGRPDRYRRVVAVCHAALGDLGREMVRAGLAMDYRRYSGGAYQADQIWARDRRLGAWVGPFEDPWVWRAAR